MKNAKASHAPAGLAQVEPPVQTFVRRSDMQTNYLYIRRFLVLIKIILTILWLILKIVEALK